MRWGDGRVSSMLVMRPDRLKFWFQNLWVILAMLRSQAQENVSINTERGGFLGWQDTLSRSGISRFSERSCLKEG